jgi:ethanolamine transporter
VTVGLVIGLAEFLLQKDFVPYTAPIEEGVMIVFNVVAVEAGAFPLVFVLSKVLKKPLKKIGEKVGINETSAVGFLATLATSVTTFGQMKDMDDRGVLLNSAFAVAAAFTFADHLAFTLSFAPDYVPAVTVAKLVGGILSVALAWILFCRKDGKITLQNEKKVV